MRETGACFGKNLFPWEKQKNQNSERRIWIMEFLAMRNVMDTYYNHVEERRKMLKIVWFLFSFNLRFNWFFSVNVNDERRKQQLNLSCHACFSIFLGILRRIDWNFSIFLDIDLLLSLIYKSHPFGAAYICVWIKSKPWLGEKLVRVDDGAEIADVINNNTKSFNMTTGVYW